MAPQRPARAYAGGLATVDDASMPCSRSFLRTHLVGLLLAVTPAPAAAAAPEPGPDPAPVGAWPLAGTPRVVAAFSPPSQRWERGHRGVDLAGAPAAPVLAALPGVVSYAGRIAGRGVVVVDHGTTRTTYEPVLAEVATGDPVAAGERIGWLHTTGSHCAPAACLHWGWRQGEVYLDPLDLVGGGGVRLLPLWALPGPVPMVVPMVAPQARGWAWR